jgi:SAM-dependent methyltransferase
VVSKTSYDAIRYPGTVVPNTSPNHLALCSLWHQGPRPLPERYRLVELGCGDGANLLPLAFYHPGSDFIGIDSSAEELERARRGAASLGLKNIRLVPQDVRVLVSTDFEPCDYIVAHGLYSWVPQDAREALLGFCRQTLTPSGLAYISYNAQPGWAIRRLVREILLRARPVREAALDQKAQRAQQVAARLLEDLPSRDYAYAVLLADELERVRNARPGYVFHEYLAEVNDGFWLGDFVRDARGHGLDYLGDAQFGRWEGYVPEQIRSALAGRKLDRVEQEETADLIGDRYFRASILCRADAPRTSATPRALLDEVRIAGSLSAQSDAFDLTEGLAEGFIGHGRAEVTLEASITKAAVLLLASRWPSALPLDTLHRQALDFLDTHGHAKSQSCLAQLSDDVITLFEAGQVDLRLGPGSAPGRSSEPPKAHALARFEAGHREALTTRAHLSLPLSPGALAITRALDGCRSRVDLERTFGAAALNQTLTILNRWGLLVV